jgi:hypothetical protein
MVLFPTDQQYNQLVVLCFEENTVNCKRDDFVRTQNKRLAAAGEKAGNRKKCKLQFLQWQHWKWSRAVPVMLY